LIPRRFKKVGYDKAGALSFGFQCAQDLKGYMAEFDLMAKLVIKERQDQAPEV
jgi:hypothetical protein